MKKTAAIFLLCIFLFNVGGYFVAFKVTQYQIKKEIKTQIKLSIDPAELVAITIKKIDIKTIDWKENGKEFFYKNELYDIVKSSETSTSVTYYCINDKKEKLLFANLDEHIKIHIASDKPINDAGSKKIVDHVVKLYFPNEQFSVLNDTNPHSVFSIVNINYSTVYIETNSPPPEFI